MITEEILTAAGYRSHPDSVNIKQYCDRFYQKKVKDSHGTRYFIGFWHYPQHEYDAGKILPATWLFELNLNEPHSTLEIHRPTDLELCENKADAFWHMMGEVYYETDEPTTTV